MKAGRRNHLYFVRAGDAGPIKVGVTTDPYSRLQCLQTAHYEQLEMLACVEAPVAMEALVLSRFAPAVIRGEWLWPVPMFLQTIDEFKSGTRTPTLLRRDAHAQVRLWLLDELADLGVLPTR